MVPYGTKANPGRPRPHPPLPGHSPTDQRTRGPRERPGGHPYGRTGRGKQGQGSRSSPPVYPDLPPIGAGYLDLAERANGGMVVLTATVDTPLPPTLRNWSRTLRGLKIPPNLHSTTSPNSDPTPSRPLKAPPPHPTPRVHCSPPGSSKNTLSRTPYFSPPSPRCW
jgi:hypothetical protein